jgi:glycerol kinase
MSKFVLALDQGTTSSRAIVFNEEGNVVSSAQKEFTQFFPKPAWVEHDAEEIWSTQIGVAAEAITKSGLTPKDIAAIGITNQRETTIVWHRKTGKPIYPAIVWQDRRTTSYCDELKKAGHQSLIREKTGLVIDPYFSGTKLKWILDNVDQARVLANRGELCFGTVDSWLLWKLTNGDVHATDVSNASRTMLLNIHSLEWDTELLDLMGIPPHIMPAVKSSSEVYGYTSGGLTGASIPVAGMAGDQQAALFGQLCTIPGMVKNTYGTGCFMLMQTGAKPVISQNNLLTTVAWQIGGMTSYALEGSVFIGGAVVQWLRDGLKIIRHSGEIAQLASGCQDTDGVYIVPAFAGLGAPYWNADARGIICGITRGTTDAHIARAALESIAWQSHDLLAAMQADSRLEIHELKVDGGATINDMLMQFQADILQAAVVRPVVTETTALGAAYLAGLATGVWSSVASLHKQWQVDHTFNPAMTAEERELRKIAWQKAVKAAINWAQ